MVKQRYRVNGIQQKIVEEINRDFVGSVKNIDAKIPKMFRVRSASDVLAEAADQPDPVELYPTLIIEDEITILFADTGIGKSVFAVQLCDKISQQITTLYLDLELSDKQFEKRCRREDGTHYPFNPKFYRADMRRHFTLPDGVNYEDYFIESLLENIKETGARFVVIDNMTKLSTGDTDTAKASIPLMARLEKIKVDHRLTMLLLEHNKKVDSSRPISLNDLQGSKMKANFADAIFTIGKSHSDPKLRYIKQLKVRSAELIYDTSNVMNCELVRENGLLKFRCVGFGDEIVHLRTPSYEKEVRTNEAKELHIQGMSNSEIARRYGVSEGAVRKWIKKE